jgi:uncharacterized membrane protein YsdA (DUF1294 family)
MLSQRKTRLPYRIPNTSLALDWEPTRSTEAQDLGEEGRMRQPRRLTDWNDDRPERPAFPSLGVAASFAVSAVFLLVVIILVASKVAPIQVLGVYAVLSVVSFVAYGWDKHAAVSGGWRTPERTLHLLSLAGGWPGALVAQTVFRHKTRKRSFQIAFWFTVVANCILLAIALTESAVWR